MTILQEVTINKPNLKQFSKVIKGRINNCKVISTKSLDLKDEEVERNPKLVELEIEEVKLFDKFDP